MEERVRYSSFEELKQETVKAMDVQLATKRHKEMEKILREWRDSWLEQKKLKKEPTKNLNTDE